MKLIDSAAIGFCLVFAAGVASAQGPIAGAQCVAPAASNFQSISRAEVELLVADATKSNPLLLKRFEEDPELKKEQLDNLRELLGSSTQAVREGYAKDPINCGELENIKDEVTAVNYDRELNKKKGPMPAFGFISQARVDGYWGGAEAKKRESEFKRFMATKVDLLKASAPDMKARQISQEEEVQARDFFARIQIYANEFEQKAPTLPKSFRDKIQLQVKLQQAQFLARLYSETVAKKAKVSDEEVEAYIRSRPELDPAARRSKAEQILKRAKAGEDFAKLADEFSDDPGNTGDAGKKHGGLYSGIRAGQMVAPFEKAALSVEPGNVYPELAKTDFGYHIIKLEKKGFGSVTYDARHILVSTMYKDPADPLATDVPVGQYARTFLEAERERKLTEELVGANKISVPDDFTVPTAAAAKTPTPKASGSRSRKRPVRKRN